MHELSLSPCLTLAVTLTLYLSLLMLSSHRFQDLEDCSEDVNLRHQLWASRSQWAAQTAEWLSTPLDKVAGESLEDTVQQMNKKVYKIERGLVPNKVCVCVCVCLPLCLS